MLCKYRALKVETALRQTGATQVRSGPFEGVQLPKVSEGSHVPKLLGAYEQDLHPILAHLPARGYEAVINIGCAEGYYTVGLARLLPDATVYAFDTNPEARRLCRQTAALNSVAERVRIGEQFSTSDFEPFAGTACFVLCDIEGAELEVLQPSRAPALATMDLVVEVHDDVHAGCGHEIRRRFEATHHIETIRFGTRQVDAFPELSALENLDQLLAFWEWRLTGNHWLWMQAEHSAP